MNKRPRPENEQAIHKAAANGHAECVAVILAHSRPDDVYAYTWALCLAVAGGHFECAKLLLPVSNPADSEALALRLATSNGHRECALLLLQSLPKRVFSSSILMAAAKNGHFECLPFLIPSSSASLNTAALQLAATNGHAECAKLLIPASESLASSPEAFFMALGAGRSAVVSLMLAHEPLLFDLLELSSSAEARARGRAPDMKSQLASEFERRELSSLSRDAIVGGPGPCPPQRL